MLSSKQKLMLTAYVDGELTDIQRKRVKRFLHKSREARKLLRSLKEDSQLLIRQPKLPAPPGFVERVMKAVESLPEPAVKQTTTASPEPVTSAKSVSPWLGLAIAAGVLLCITLGSFLFFTKVESNSVAPVSAVELAFNAGDPALVTPLLDLPIQALEQPAVQQAVGKQLREHAGVQVDLASKNSVVTTKHLAKVLGKKAIEMVESSKIPNKSSGKTYLVFVENVSPEEANDILVDLAQTKTADQQVSQVVLNPLVNEKRQQLAAVLGVPVEDLIPDDGDEKAAIDIINNKIIASPKEGNAKKGKTNQPKRFAVVVAYDGTTPDSGISMTEVMRFVKERRATRTPGTIQMMFVVHQNKAA